MVTMKEPIEKLITIMAQLDRLSIDLRNDLDDPQHRQLGTQLQDAYDELTSCLRRYVREAQRELRKA